MTLQASNEADVTAEFPKKLGFLFRPSRYKVAYGGRGGAKSWGFARALLIEGTQRKLRILCTRDIQDSIADSVHALLTDQIEAMGLGSKYEVQKTSIVGTNGTEFLFAGLKHKIKSLKSFEGADIVWVEEAQTVVKTTWDTLIPTIRKKGSEIWVSFNPELAEDDTYQRFVVNPPPTAVVVKIDWRDNPWFPEELRLEKDDLQQKNADDYAHIWEGKPKSALTGAIYASELALADSEGRIGTVPCDRTKPVDTFWDLGFGDSTAIWFAQARMDGSYRMIDYLEDAGKTIDHYIVQVQQRGYLQGTDWLPHDAVDMIVHKRLGADPTRSIEMLMRNAGRKVMIAPKQHVSTGINAARTIFSQCWFDQQKCADGLQALRHYQWAPTTAGGVEARAPLHNWASHGADAFRILAYGIKTPEKPAVVMPRTTAQRPSPHGWMG